MARLQVRIEAHGLVELLTGYGGQCGTLAELAPVLSSVPTVNASLQRWRYGFANEWRSCGLGIRPACPGRARCRRPSCSQAPVTSRSPRHRALIRLRWPAVACPLGCLV